MSGLTATDSSQDSTNQPESEDPAASLRELALRSLKSKRRKLNTNLNADLPSTIPARPIPSSAASIQLDYGQAEPSVSDPIASSVPSALVPEDPSRMDVDDDGQAKEEGEISDSDTPATPVNPPVMSPPKPPAVVQSPEKVLRTPSSVAIAPAPSAVLIKTESLPAVLPEASPIASTSVMEPMPDYDLPFDPDLGYIRPGLAMSQHQYDVAKDILLELLGWGVPPEYLVRTGLSREMVYYAFLDLQLQVPEILDTTGLPTLDELIAMASNVLARRSRTASASPSVSLPSQPHSSQPHSSEDHISTNVVPSTLSAVAQPFVPTPKSDGTDQDLHDMEQQRRQQLLARKIAQASRKPKQTSPSDSTRPSQTAVVSAPTDVGRASSVVPPMAVDDFLNSIEHARGSSREGSKGPLSRVGSLDDMDVDGPPGLSMAGVAVTAPVRRTETLARLQSLPDTSSTPGPSDPSPLRAQLSPTPLQRTDTMVSASSSSGSSTPSIGAPGSGHAHLRRGTKRPVAADFVDMEPGPSRASNGHNGNHTLAHTHHHPHHHGYLRKKQASFAVVSSKPRRMVIDLTDSEDEGDGEDSSAHPNGRHARTSAPLPNAQSALEERERQIQELKDRIARKELEARLKREAALMSGRGTPTTREAVAESSVPSVVVKVEEDDMSATASLQAATDHVSKEPPDSSAPSVSDVPSSPATPVTPIDIARNVLEHTATGDKVLTDEAQQEHVNLSTASTPDSTPEPPHGQLNVDVVDSQAETSSTQTMLTPFNTEGAKSEASPSFQAYQSPLTEFPLLRLHSSQQFIGDPQHHSASDLASGFYVSNTFIDLRPLRMISIAKQISDPSTRICQYEVPGGGECRDFGCPDIHPSKLSLHEPGDEEMAQYLSSVLPSGLQIDVDKLQAAVANAHRRTPAGLEARAVEALASLGIR